MDQHSTPSSCLPLLLLLVALPLLFSLVYFGLVGVSFESLGLTRVGALLLLLASLAGGMINVPLNRRRLVLDDPRNEQLPSWLRWMLPYVHYYPPLVTEQVIAINLGGALIPLGFSVYLLTRPQTHLLAALVATIVVALIAKLLAHPVPGVGITMPDFATPIVAAGLAFLLLGAPRMGPLRSPTSPGRWEP